MPEARVNCSLFKYESYAEHETDWIFGRQNRTSAALRRFLNHPDFALPSAVAGTPGRSSTQTGFGALVATSSPPTGLRGVGLGGDNSPRMVALQLRLEF